MIRKLSLAMAVAAALNPLNAYALGLGDIEVKSALNQTLNAHIQLHSLAEGELSGVVVKLASPADFSKSGLERPFSLTKLQFKPEEDSGGKPVIKVTSRDPVREPFLNFLIEVNWSSGKLLREYTLLLDPPTTLKRRPPRVNKARLKAPPAQVKRSSEQKRSAPVSMTGDKQVKVRRHDNLWNIARRNQVAGVSTEEMMQAIYDANPDAFYQADINSLKSGVILRIPTSQQGSQSSTAEGRNEYISGVSAWESTTPMTESKAPETRVETSPPITTGKPRQTRGEHLEILSAKPDEKGSAGDQAGKSGNAQVDRLLKDLLLAKEATESARMENTELQDRVSSLQSQVSDLQRLITLKNNQLAKLQERAKNASEKTRLAEEKAASLAKQQQQKDQQLKALQSEKDQQIKALEQESAAEKARLAEQQAEREQKIKALEEEKQRQMRELQAAKAAEKEKLAKAQAEKEKQIKALQAEKEAEKVRLAKEQAEKEAQIKALQAEKEAAEALAKLDREKKQKAAKVSKPAAKAEVKPQAKTAATKPKAEAKPQPKPQPKPKPAVTKKAEPVEQSGFIDDLLSNPLLLAGGGGGASRCVS